MVSGDELGEYFFFDEQDRRLIARRRRDANRLGFAVQLGTVRCPTRSTCSTGSSIPRWAAPRHAAELATEGLPVNLIQQQLGHGSLATTDRYLRHIAPRERVEALQAQAREP